jgi:hypothetical protein
MFDEFELYWFGRRFEGLPLTYVRQSVDGDGVVHYRFAYGELSYFGDAASGSWLSPLEIDIQPYCGFGPEDAESAYGDGFKNVKIGGAEGYLYDDFWLFLWSGRSEIQLSWSKTQIDLEEAAQDLIPIAEDTGANPEPLPAPISTEC